MLGNSPWLSEFSEQKRIEHEEGAVLHFLKTDLDPECFMEITRRGDAPIRT